MPGIHATMRAISRKVATTGLINIRSKLKSLGSVVVPRSYARSLGEGYSVRVDPETNSSEDSVRAIGPKAGTFMPHGFGWPTVMKIEPVDSKSIAIVFLVDAGSLLKHLCHVQPAALPSLFSTQGCLYDQSMFPYTFYERREPGVYHARIPKDCDWYYGDVHVRSKESIVEIPLDVSMHKLHPQQSLLVDNRRMLLELPRRGAAFQLASVNGLFSYRGGCRMSAEDDMIISSMMCESP